MRRSYRLGTAALGVLCMLSVSVQNARAQIDDSWMSFGASDETTEWEQPYDRSFIREWETNPVRGYPTMSRDNIGPLKVAIKRYSRIVRSGGWRALPKNKTLRTGMRGALITRLRRRLELTGDLKKGSGYTSVFDYYVEQAVKKFQKRHGLTPTGYVDKTTILALNVPASARLRQLRTNIIRLKNYVRTQPKKYIFVNIPAAQVEAVQNDRVVSRHAGVVGKLDRQTPILQSRVEKITFNPYWTVPPTVLKKDLIPKARQYARKGKDIVAEYRFTVFDKAGREINPKDINWFSDRVYDYVYRQDPWEENSMGFVKIRFPNRHAVFLHDTPSKRLFGRNFRAESSGCVRVQNIQQLVTWALQGGKEHWSRKRVAQIKRSKEQLETKPAIKLPIYLAYITAWSTPDGTVNFRRDIYKRDGVSATASAY